MSSINLLVMLILSSRHFSFNGKELNQNLGLAEWLKWYSACIVSTKPKLKPPYYTHAYKQKMRPAETIPGMVGVDKGE
jgi:hypothetical protein